LFVSLDHDGPASSNGLDAIISTLTAIRCRVLWALASWGCFVLSLLRIEWQFVGRIVAPLAESELKRRHGTHVTRIDSPECCFKACPYMTRFVSLSPKAAPKSCTTAILHIHGGAYQTHTATEHPSASWLLRLCDPGTVYLSVGYTLAPAATFAQQVGQAIACLRHLVEVCGASSVSLVGDSAGGGIALGVLLELFEHSDQHAAPHLRDALAAAVLVSPWVPSQVDAAPHTALPPPPLVTDYLPSCMLRQPALVYLAGGGPPREAVVPRLRACAAALPPVLVVAGGGEVCLPTATAVADALLGAAATIGLGPEPAVAAALPPRHAVHVAPGEPHDFPMLPSFLLRSPAAPRAAWTRAAALINGAVREREARRRVAS